MKTLVTNIWVMVIGLIMLGFTSCSTDNVFGDEEDWYTPTAPTDTTTTPTPEPEIPEDSIDWSREMQKSFGYNRQTGEWPSTILVHYTNGKDSLWIHNCPMTTTISGPREIIVDSTAAPSRFISSTIISTETTPWMPENAPIQERLVTTQWAVNMTNFTDTITATHVEARIQINGHEVLFLHGDETLSAPSKKDDTPTAGADVEINGKSYTVEIANISMDHKLHTSFQTNVQWSTRVLREKTVPAVPEDPSMPTPNLKVKKIINIPNYSYSPEWLGLPTNDRVKAWHKVLPVLAEDEDGIQRYHIWVDGTYVCSVEKGSEKVIFDSAYLAEGSWRPAKLSSDSSGWRYDFIVNGEGKFKSIYGSLSLIEDLKNFAKAHNAGQTPQILTEKTSTSYNGHQYVVVKGYSIGMEALISTTIGEVF